MEDEDRCLYAIGIEKKLARGETPENPFLDVACLLCYDKPERQSPILCFRYFNRSHLMEFNKLRLGEK